MAMLYADTELDGRDGAGLNELHSTDLGALLALDDPQAPAWRQVTPEQMAAYQAETMLAPEVQHPLAWALALTAIVLAALLLPLPAAGATLTADWLLGPVSPVPEAATWISLLAGLAALALWAMARSPRRRGRLAVAMRRAWVRALLLQHRWQCADADAAVAHAEQCVAHAEDDLRDLRHQRQHLAQRGLALYAELSALRLAARIHD